MNINAFISDNLFPLQSNAVSNLFLWGERYTIGPIHQRQDFAP